MGLLSRSEYWCLFSLYVTKSSFAFAGSAPFRFLVWINLLFSLRLLFAEETRKHECTFIFIWLLGLWRTFFSICCQYSEIRNKTSHHWTAYSLRWCVGFLEYEVHGLRIVFSRSDTWMNAQVSLLIENKVSRSVYECWLGKIIFFKCYSELA